MREVWAFVAGHSSGFVAGIVVARWVFLGVFL